MKRKVASICIIASSLATAMTWASEDISSTVGISGTIYSSEPCEVSLTSNVMQLGDTAISALPLQGKNINPEHTSSIGIQFTGDSCKRAKGFKLIGTADKTGTTLLNSLTSESAAQGVGIGIYKHSGVPVELNTGTNPIIPESYGAYPIYFNLVKLNDEEQTSGPVQASLTVELETL